MDVRVRLARWIVRTVLMLMMGVMNMCVRMLHGLVLVVMLVVLG
jgi:hypothetical protein